MGRSTLKPCDSDTCVHQTWTAWTCRSALAKSNPSPESIWRQRRRTPWRSGSWGWAGSACRRLPSELALCPTEWPRDGRERWWLPRILCLGAENTGGISHSPDNRREVISCADDGPLPLPVLTVVGLKAFHTMVSQMLVAMNREIPEPRP